MAGTRTSPSVEANITKLQPDANLQKLRAELQRDPKLRKELFENPAAVLEQFKIGIVAPAGTIARIKGGGGFDLPGNAGLHADAHADAHVDVDPHLDFTKHIDLF